MIGLLKNWAKMNLSIVDKNRIIQLLNLINNGIYPYKLFTPEEKIEYIVEKIGCDDEVIRKIAVENGYNSYAIINKGE